MDIGLLSTIFRFIIFLVQIYYFGMIIYFFTSWVPSIRESKFGEFLGKLYEPFLEPFRKIIPPIGFIDISFYRGNLRSSFIPKWFSKNI